MLLVSASRIASCKTQFAKTCQNLNLKKAQHLPSYKYKQIHNQTHNFPQKTLVASPSTTSSGLLLGVGLGLAGLALWNYLFDDKRANVSLAASIKKGSESQSQPPLANLAQPTVVSGVPRQAAFAIINLSKSADLKAVAAACSKLPEVVNAVLDGEDPKKINAGISFGTSTWEQLSKALKKPLPSNFSHFSARKGKYGNMPATGGDLFLHVKGDNLSQCYETVDAFVNSLPKGSVASVDDKYGFQYQDGRDLSGFLDGTENPADDKNRRSAALLPDGGSYVIHQRWLHNLPPFHSKRAEEQEKIVGRSKPDSAELSPLPKSSHVTRTRDESGNKIPIVRQSMPFGTVGGDHGLLFIAYSSSPSKFDIMLDRMTGKDGENDDIMTFSKCVASNYYYIPSTKELVSLGK